VEDREEVALVDVVVDLRALASREHVLDVERMPAEAAREQSSAERVGLVEMDPGEAGGAELSGRPRLRDDRREVPRAGARTTDAREARHRY
jgi:hypothetical protein